jgi:hypothetical protein
MAINNDVHEALKKCLIEPDYVLETDLQFFCQQATGDKVTPIQQLVYSFGNDEDAKLQKISFKQNQTSLFQADLAINFSTSQESSF